MSWAWAPGSPWIMPLGEEKVSRQLEVEAGVVDVDFVWEG